MKEYNLSGVDASLKDLVYKACGKLGLKIDDSEGVKVNVAAADAASLEIKPDEIIINYVKKHQVFYALKLMAVNDKKKSFKKQINCAFDHFGVMADCSRNAVPTVEFLKEYILSLALMGYNELQLYTEDTYEVEGEPLFGYMRGRYSIKELREIVDYAAEFDIEVVPCIQTLAHLNQLLRWQKYDAVRDIDDILLVGEDKTYELIDKMFASLAKAFTSRRVHIGMDEAHNVGRGKYLDINGYEDTNSIMKKHLERVIAIAEKYGFKPMMWSDMFFRMLNGGGYYIGENTAHITDEVRDSVPGNLELVYWDYYQDEKRAYDIMFERHAEFGNKTVFAGGAWKWTGFAPRNRISCNRSALAFASAEEHGIKDVFLTMWGDDGAECPWNAVLPALSYSADLAYGDKEHEECFAALTGMNFDDFCALDLPDSVKENALSKTLLFTDCFTGLIDLSIEYGDADKFRSAAAKLKKIARNAGSYAYMFDCSAKLCEALATKVTLGKQTRELYMKIKHGDEQTALEGKKEIKKLVAKSYKPLVKQLEAFYAAFKVQWNKENKPFGFEVQDIRIGGLIHRIKHCASDLDALVKGKVASLQELEEYQLPADVTGYYADKNSYSASVSANKLSW